MKNLYLITLTLLAACSTAQTPQAVDNTPGTKTVNEYDKKMPCSAVDSRRGMCLADPK